MSLKRNAVLVLAIVLALAAALSADTIKIRRPSNRQSVSGLQPAQKFYSLQSEEQLRALFDNESAFCIDLGRTVGSFPRGIEMQWSFAGARDKIHYELKYADNPGLDGAVVIHPPHSTYFLHNLELGRTYYWQVSAVYDDGSRLDSTVSSFTVDNVAPRVMNVPNVDNFRDLGGKPGLGGRIAAQGMIYRSTGLNNNSSDGKVPGSARFTDEGRRIMLEDLGLKTELDLRSLGETAGMTVSPLGESVKYINISSTSYGGIYSESGRENYAKLFRVFCDRDNYPIDFHCIAGADRTGSLGFLLGATLGYSVRDLIIDYTYTSFMGSRPPQMFDMLYLPMLAHGQPSESLSCKAERYLLLSGITPAEIQAFRDIMLGPGTTLDPSNEMYVKALERVAVGEPAGDGLVLCYQTTDEKAGRLCGKDYDITALSRSTKNILTTGDEQGGFTFLLPPSAIVGEYVPLVLIADPARLTAASYTVASPNAKCVYTHDGGKTAWTAAELNKFCCKPPRGFLILEVRPGAAVDADWEKVEVLDMPDYPVMPAAVTDTPPVLDGKLDDPVWQRAVFKAMTFTDGGLVTSSERLVAVALDEKAETLYLAAKVPDATPVWVGEGHDSSVYDGDSVELFLSAMGSDDYYQFVFNLKGGVYDGHRSDPKWDSEGVRMAATTTDGGWLLEVAVPLAQFNFQAPLELNVCSADYKEDKTTGNSAAADLYNLWTTNGYFHNRSAIRPVKVMK